MLPLWQCSAGAWDNPSALRRRYSIRSLTPRRAANSLSEGGAPLSDVVQQAYAIGRALRRAIQPTNPRPPISMP